ncbi:MAG: DUF4065 domain-containing protein [Clostridiales bacterium]|jgi:uncharacterized phage-associated protein|nr:DUF4065 domain-containing protein [Clostridiales bacterium]
MDSNISIVDVAAYFLHVLGQISCMKLHKLCYFAQGWWLAWTGTSLFPEDFQAWASGPVCPILYELHKDDFVLKDGFFGISDPSEKFTSDQIEALSVIISEYGSMRPIDITGHSRFDTPWKDARGNVPNGRKCTSIITKDSMKEYYTRSLSHGAK